MLTAVSYVSYWYRPSIALRMKEFCEGTASVLDAAAIDTPQDLSQVTEAVEGLYWYVQTGRSVGATLNDKQTVKSIESSAKSIIGDTEKERELRGGTWVGFSSALAGLVICLYAIVWYGRESEQNKVVQRDLLQLQAREAVDLSMLKPVRKTTVSRSKWRQLTRRQKKQLSAGGLLAILKL